MSDSGSILPRRGGKAAGLRRVRPALQVLMKNESRREFLKTSVGAACAAAIVTSAGKSIAASPPAEAVAIKKGIWMEMLPGNLSYAERLKMAREVGFEVMQAPTQPDEGKAEELRKEADAAWI